MRRRIIEAAVEAIAAEGPGASTAAIAKHAGIAQESIFHHFETEAGLLNAVYPQLKHELRMAVLDDLPDDDVRDQMHAVWLRWMEWGASGPVRRRALYLLGSSPVVSDESRARTA